MCEIAVYKLRAGTPYRASLKMDSTIYQTGCDYR
jgi:hypothetical protein